MMRSLRRAVTVSTMAAVVYALVVRPKLMRWGATEDEVRSDYPGADVVDHGVRAATMAVTIDAPPSEVWSWLLQMGYDHAGWYSWDRLDNGGRPSSTKLHPDWQQLATGDHIKAWAPGGPVDAWQVAVLDTHHFLGLRGLSDLRGHVLDPALPRPAAYTEGLWGFRLDELPGDRTRLVVSGYQTARPRWFEHMFNYWIYPLMHWPMQTRQFANLKRNAERHYCSTQPFVPRVQA
jgi:proline iminopeptidase